MRVVEPLFGRFIVPHGRVTCVFYCSEIFAVDFDARCVTNFGMTSYSMSTGQNISGWEGAFRALFGQTVGVDPFWQYRSWSFDSRKTQDPLYLRFVKHVPWVHVDRNGIGWFHWPRYDEPLAEIYFSSRGYLRTDQNWRYFEFDWTEDGRWERKFIDDAARRRWEARERKKRKDGHVSREVSTAP